MSEKKAAKAATSTTTDGQVISEAEEARLAAEFKADDDALDGVEFTSPRMAGRPSLTGRTGTSPQVAFRPGGHGARSSGAARGQPRHGRLGSRARGPGAAGPGVRTRPRTGRGGVSATADGSMWSHT